MKRQIELVRFARCEHSKKSAEIIRSESGKPIAERCGLCHRVVYLKRCNGCLRTFRLTQRSAKRGRIYHAERCRQAAYRRRKVQRLMAETA